MDEAQEIILNKSQIIITTCSISTSKLIKELGITRVIIDEAS